LTNCNRKDLCNAGARRFIKKRGGLINLLKDVYPCHNWKVDRFSSKQKKSSQWWLCKVLTELFSTDTVILEEFHLPLPFIQTGYLMVFDIYIPSLNLIFDYHGIQHYYDHYMFGNVQDQQERDKQRRAACNYLNISYLEVPYWWQRDKESVTAMIHEVRPDIVPHPLVTPFQYADTKLSSRKELINVIKNVHYYFSSGSRISLIQNICEIKIIGLKFCSV